MKRRITFMMAAFALLAFLAIPLGMRGQATTYTSNVTLPQSGTSVSSCKVSINGTQYDGTKLGKNGAGASANVTIPSGTTTLYVHCAAWNGKSSTLTLSTTVSGVSITPSAAWSLTSDSGINNSSPFTLAAPDNASTSYFKEYTLTGVNSEITVRFTAGSERAVFWGVNAVVGGDTPPADTYTVTFDAGDGTFEGNNDFPNTTNSKAEGTYTLPSATRNGYTFDGWLLTGNTEPLTGSYTVSSDVDFTAQYTESTTPPGPSGDEWVLTSLDELTSSDVFVIVSTKGTATYAMSNDKGTNAAPTAVAVTVSSSTLTGTVAENIQWTGLSGDGTNGYTIYSNADNSKYLYCISNNNGVRVGAGSDKTFVIKDDYIYNLGQLRYIGVYNNADWRCYTTIHANIAGQTFSFFKKVTSGTPAPSITTANVDIAYDATSGAIGYTINNPVEGGTLTAATNDSWLTLGTADTIAVPFSCSANDGINARTATVTLTYAYGENDETVSKNVTVTQAGNPNVASITVNPTTVNVTADEADGTLTVTYNNITEVLAEVHFCDANGDAATYDWIMAEIDQNNNVYYVINANEGEARTAYLKVYALDDNAEGVYSALITINQAAYVAPSLATLPFAFDGGRADIANTDGLSHEGLDSDYSSSPKLKFNTTGDWLMLRFNEAPGKLTFDIKGSPSTGSTWSGTFKVQTSEDGVTYTDLETYTSLTATTQSEEFNNLGENVRYIKWIFTQKSNGNVALGNITLALPNDTPSITLNNYLVDASATETEGTLEVTYHNITEVLAEVYFCDAEGQTATYDWIEAEIDENNDVYYVIAANDGEARTAYFKVYALDDNAEDVYSGLVTINQAAYIAPPAGEQYVLFTGDLVEGDYLIVYNGVAMKDTITSSGRFTYKEVTSDDDVIVTEDASIVWHIAPDGDYWTIYSYDAGAYAAGTGVNGKAKMLELVYGDDDKALWTVTGTGTYNFVNKANAAVNVSAYLRRNGDYGFACYASGTGGALSLYKSSNDHPFVAKPTFSPRKGRYVETQEVTISCPTQGATVYYTTDGSNPTTESDVYTEPVQVSEDVSIIKAFAVVNDTLMSGVSRSVYNINPDEPGTESNPHVLSATIPSQLSSENVYVRGVISEIATTESEVTQYHDISYYISVDGNPDNQLFVRYGMNVDSTEFFMLSELQIGDRVVVRGKLEIGSDTHGCSGPRLASRNYIVSLERSVEAPYFSTPSCMLVNDENALVYIFCDTYEAEIRYTMDGTEPDLNSLLYNEAEPVNLQGVTGTITIKAIAYYEGMHSAISTVTYRMVEPGTPGTMETPYTVAQILHILDSVPTIDQVYVRGIVCTNPIIEQGIYHNANYYIADSLTAAEDNQLYVYRGKGLGGEPIDSEDDLRKGDIVTVLGDLQIYYGVKEFKQYSIIYEWERLSSIDVSSSTVDNCDDRNGSLNVSFYNIYFQVNPPTVQLCDVQGNEAEYDWLTVTLNGDYVDYHVNAAGEDVVLPRTAYLKVIGHDWSGNEVVSNIASITQTECVFAPLPFRYAYRYKDSEGNYDDEISIAHLEPIPDGLEVIGLGSYYSSYPYLRFDAPNDTTGQQDYIKLAFAEEPSRLTFDILGDGFRGGYFFLETSTDGLEGNWNIIAVYTTTELIAQMGDGNPLKPVAKVMPTGRYETMTFDNLPSDVRYLRWIYETRSVGNVRLGDIHLYTPDELFDIVLIQPEYDGCSIAADKAIAVEGETVTLSYELADDYTFVDWIVKDGNDNAIEVANNRFQMPASDVTVATELGMIQKYDIVLIQPEFDNCSIAADKARAAEGDTVTLSYDPAEGYYFVEWNVTDENGDAVAVNDNQFIMPASDVTVEAVMVEATTEYQYVYSINGVETEPQTAVIGQSITLTDGSNINAFEFIGWTTDPNDVENVMPAEAPYTIMEDMTFYAVYNYSDTTAVNQYVKVTENLEDWSGDYLIVYDDGNLAFNGGLATLDAVNNTIAVTIANDVIASDATTDAAKFTIEALENGYSIKSASGKYVGRTGNSNGLDANTDMVYPNAVTYNVEDGIVDIVSGGAYLRYNATAGQTRFRYFKSSTYTAQKAIQLYKYSGRTDERYTRVFVDNPEGAVAIAGPSIIPSGYVLNVSSITNELGADKLLIEEGAQLVTSSNVNATMRKTINGFQGEGNDNYCFISSPVNNLDPADLGMVGGNYDLYYFDQDSTDAEWQNYKAEQFDLTTGMGYLYAKASGGTITVAGMMNGSAGSTTLDGWYLIGNPYPCNVTINVPFYRLDESGAALVLTGSNVAIAPMEGVLVHVEGVTVSFTKAPQVSTIDNTGSKVMFKINKQ